MQDCLTPEMIVVSLSVLVVSSIIVSTLIVLYKDKDLRNILTRAKSYLSVQRRKNKKTKQISIKPSASQSSQSEDVKDTEEIPWEEFFKVTDPINEDSQTIDDRLIGTCTRCKIYSAKRNCKLNACGICCRGDPLSVCRAHGTGYQSAINELNAAIQYDYIEVDISYSNLKLCPTNVTSLNTTHLVSLNLSNNRLTAIPDDIGLLKGLKELFLQYNYLSHLPDSICLLVNLIELDVKNNLITSLPLNIGRLRQLIIFCSMNNALSFLPSSIGNLVNLEELSLLSNMLQSLPEEICKLHSLKLFYCGENKLKDLPDNIGELVQLEEVDLSHNHLVILPGSICRCRQLKRLWLTGNRLKEIPSQIGLLDNLKELHVRNNCLRYFPISVQELSLYTFSAQHNPILKEHQIRKLSHTPRLPFPPLLELAARVVSAENVNKGGAIPLNLEDLLSRGVVCSKCGRKAFVYYTCNVSFAMVGVYYRLPLYEILCSPHNKNSCM